MREEPKSVFLGLAGGEQLMGVTVKTNEAASDERAWTVRPMRGGPWRQMTSGALQAPWAVLAGVLLLALLAAACTSGDGNRGSATGTTARTTSAAPATTSAPTTTAPATATVVLADYRAFWDDMVAVGKTANWQSPRIDDHATGQALAEAQATYRSLKSRGLVARGTVKVDAKVLSIKGGTAVVYDCNSTSNFLAYDAATGELRDKSSGRSNGKTVTMLLRGGTWKVAKTVTEVGRCTR